MSVSHLEAKEVDHDAVLLNCGFFPCFRNREERARTKMDYGGAAAACFRCSDVIYQDFVPDP